MNKISKRGLRCKRFFEKNFMFFRRRGNTRISGGFPHIKLETANTVSGAPGAQRPENRPLPRHAGLLRRRLPRSGQLLQRDEGQRGMGRRAPRPPTDGQPATDRRCGSLASVMALPSPMLPVANWELGLKTGNIGTLATLPAPSTVNTSKTERFLVLLYQSPSLPKLPPHFAKCGGNQKNDNLPYFLLINLNTHEELFRC